MFKAILWKEWREQRWRIAYGTVILNVFLLTLLQTRVANDIEVSLMVLLGGGLTLALLSAMGPFAPEAAHHTWPFYLSRPLPVWKVVLAKWFIGWLGLAVPLFISMIIFAFFPRNNPLATMGTFGAAAKAFSSGLMISTMFYTLTCALAPRRAGEAYVGLIGLFVLVGMVLHIMVTEIMKWGNFAKIGSLGGIWSSMNPFFWFAVNETSFPFWLLFTLVPVQLVIFVVLMIRLNRKCKWSA